MQVVVVAAIGICAVAFAAILRRLEVPGAVVVGGTAAGILLGHTLLGRLSPAWYESHMVGATQERLAIVAHDDLASSRARLNSGVISSDDINQRATLVQAYQTARREHAFPWRVALSAAACLFFLGTIAAPHSSSQSSGWFQPLSIGAWAAIVPGCLGAISIFLLSERDSVAAVAGGACLAAGALLFDRRDLAASDDAEQGGSALVERSAACAFAVAMIALLTIAAAQGREQIVWVALPGAVMIIALGVRIIGPSFHAEHIPAIRNGLLPLMAGWIAMHIDWYSDFRFGLVLLIVILAGDGRWLAAWLGAQISGNRAPLRGMRLVIAAMSAGPTQLAVVAVAFSAGLLTPPVALALLLGAVFMEVTTNARRQLAREMAGLEKNEEQEDSRE